MTQVKEWSNQELNRALAELMGNKIGRKVDYGFKPEYDCDVIALPNDSYKFIPDYCTDASATAVLQARAIVVNEFQYIENLAAITQADRAWGFEDGKMQTQGISWLLNASPRERAEAAYITLQGAKENG